MGFTHRMGKTRIDRAERFERHFVPEPNSGCWLWTGCLRGAKAKEGFPYGGFQWEPTRTEFAHRCAWMLYRGEIPHGMFVCHKCDNPHCVNPDHLFLGTASDNMRDMFAKGRNKGYDRRGENASRAIMTADMVLEARASKEPLSVLAARYGVSKGAMQHAKSGKTWKHL